MYIPLFIDIGQWPVLVVGGGYIALRKAKELHQGGSDITLVTPKRCHGWEDIKVNWLQEEYNSQINLSQYKLIIAASGNDELNDTIAAEAKIQGVLCNCASHSDRGDVIIPGVVRENGITVALSTQGKAPFLTKKLKREAEKITAQYTHEIVELLADVRSDILTRYPDNKEYLLKKLSATPIEILKKKGNCHEITDWLQRE